MQFIIKRKVLISMLFTALTMLGYISYKHLPVELYPSVELPNLFVQVGTGLSVDPAYMESQAVIPLEGAIGTLKNVQKIESISDQQSGRIRISYRPGTNMKYAYLKLTEKIDETSGSLPSEFRTEVFKFDMQQINNMFMTLQVRGSGGVNRVRQIVDQDIADRLQNVDGIANAEVFGGRQKSVEILLKEDVCRAHGITPADVRSALTANNRSRTFAGMVTHNNQMNFVNVVSDFSSIDQLYNLVIKQQGPLRLKDIADIRFGVKKQDSYSRVNGKEAITIRLTRDTEANLIQLSDEVKKLISQLNTELAPQDVEIVVQSNTAETMEKNINMIIKLAITGGLLAIFVLWIFLRNIRLVVAVALAIPISVYTAFNFFYAAGITVNSLTLMGMALAIGMLLDNSVVVLENIYRLASGGMDTGKAVIQGTREVWRSILAATLTTIMVFLPFAFSENFMVELLGKNIGVSIIVTLLVSLAVALLLIPMVTHSLLSLKRNKKTISFERISIHNRLIQIYRVLLKTAMRKPAATILGALGLFFITLLISLGLSIVSSDEAEVKDMTLYVTMPGGSTLETTDQLVRQVEERLDKVKERKEIVSQVYEDEAVIRIILVEDYRKIRNYSIPKVKKEVMDRMGDLRQATFSWDPPASAQRFNGAGGAGNSGGDMRGFLGMGTGNEKIVIKGQDYSRMINLANDLKYYLDQQSSVERSTVQLPDKRPELMLNFDKQLMALYDIPVNSVLSELNSFPSEFSSGVKFKQGTDEYDIQISTVRKNKEPEEQNLASLKQLPVRGRNNAQFELQHITRFNFSDGMAAINRVNQAKNIEVYYRFLKEVQDDPDLLTAARQDVDNMVQQVQLPSGTALEVVHDERDFSDFPFLILASVLLIYMILASVFESFTTPVVLMFSIPLAAVGSLIALILTGNSLLNFVTLIGFIILLGIVVNNGIIMIDYTRVLERRGYRQQRALIMAGLARVRPILITAITTIIALMPLAMGKTEYVAQIGVPFAITVIGGLALSTLLTLVFIPTMNSGLHSSLQWFYHRKPFEKVIMIVLCAAGFVLIYTGVESLIWRIIDLTLLVILVPGTWFFVQNSLRRASETLIGPNQQLTITVRNLVKIYDRDSRFVREWKSGLNIRRRLGYEREIATWKDLDRLVWQVPFIAFMSYFIYFHIDSGFWYFLLPVLLHIMLINIVLPVKDFMLKSGKRFSRFMANLLYAVTYWGFPAFALVLFYQKYKLFGLIIPAAILWYLILLINITSIKLYQENININRLTGRFRGIRKGFYKLVKAIPLIGKKRVPFKALKGVSFTIENGMFGLLGPNGAGKSTLMRIICGVLEASYGQITINGIDVKEKREELQGLIGYLPQEFGMYEHLTALDFLHYMGILKKIRNTQVRNERVEYVLKAVHMYEHRNEKIGSFSGGMKQRIGIAQILLHLPRILVVDEPTAGLDPRERIRFRNLLVELSKERIVIFSTHIIEDVASSCSQVAVIRQGELNYLGAPVDMARIADGKVWSIDMTTDEFELFRDNFVILHHMRDGDLIRVRCLAEEAPAEKATQVKANLEDAYLYLLNKYTS